MSNPGTSNEERLSRYLRKLTGDLRAAKKHIDHPYVDVARHEVTNRRSPNANERQQERWPYDPCRRV